MSRSCALFATLSLAALACACATGRTGATAAPPTAQELAVHRAAIVVDTHSDVTERVVYEEGFDFAQRHRDGHEDLQRMREGGLDAQIFAIWLNPKRFAPDQWFAESERELERARDALTKAGLSVVRTAREVRENKARGVTSALFGVEGGHSLLPGSEEEQLAHLRRLAELGARYLTLTWSNSNTIGGASGDEGDTQGLTDFGRRAIAELERLGVVVDLSHVSDPLFWDAIRAANKPVLASHSSSRQLANVPRNMTDAMLKAVAKNGGAVCVNFFSGFLDDKHLAAMLRIRDKAAEEKLTIREVARRYAADERLPRVPLETLIDHLDHVAKVAGVDHACLGSDFDGIPTIPTGMEDVSRLPAITAALLRRGYKPDDVSKILGGNVLRILEANEPK